MSEFESLTDYEKFMHRTFHGQEESITLIVSRFTACVVPSTYSVNIWNCLM
jgi:hypothetical protein